MSSTILNLSTRSTIDGTESFVLATSGANWKAQGGTQTFVFQGVAGGTAASSTLTLESTTGAGTTDAIIFQTGSQSERMRINTSGLVSIGNIGGSVQGRLAVIGDQGDLSGSATNWIDAGTATASISFWFLKDRDATNARRYQFNDVGGLTGDGGSGAFWRGVSASGPTITDPSGGANVFPLFSMYFEYPTLTTPATRIFAFDMGNITNTTAHTFQIRSQTVSICAFTPVTSATNSISITNAASGNPPTISAGGGDTNIDLNLTGQGTGTIKFGGSGSFTADGTVATVLGSLGPTGANTTVQEWLTIRNAGGTTRYIPCF